MNIQQSKKIKIHEFLAGLGIEPVIQRGENLWYHSPYREDHNPSFSVNMEKNLFFDIAKREGGDLIVLAKLIYSCNASEALKNIEKIKPIPVFSLESKDSSILVKKVTELKNKLLINYLASRGIDVQLASKYLNDVYYSVNNRNYFAVGFKNDFGGFELRNEFWKGSIYPKNFTSIVNGCNHCILTEGFIDFLTFKQYLERKSTDYLVLNGAGMVNRAIEALKKYKAVYYFGDADSSGNMAFKTLTDAGIDLIDCRNYYAGFKDLNEKYQSKNQ
jgi:hypothetical protein